MTYNNESLVLQPNSPWFDRLHLQKALRHQPADLFNWINQSSQLFGAGVELTRRVLLVAFGYRSYGRMASDFRRNICNCYHELRRRVAHDPISRQRLDYLFDAYLDITPSTRLMIPLWHYQQLDQAFLFAANQHDANSPVMRIMMLSFDTRYIDSTTNQGACHTTYRYMRPMIINVFDCIGGPAYWRHNVEFFDKLTPSSDGAVAPTAIHDENFHVILTV